MQLYLSDDGFSRTTVPRRPDDTVNQNELIHDLDRFCMTQYGFMRRSTTAFPLSKTSVLLPYRSYKVKALDDLVGG